MSSTVGKRLKNFRQNTGTSMPQIAKDTGISKENLYKWEKGTKPSDFDEILKLEAYISDQENKNKIDKGLNGLDSPLPARQVSTENLTLKDIFGSSLHHLVTITDEAMMPDYKPGWKLCVKKLSNQRLLIWGMPYYFKMIENERGLVRRVIAGDKANEIKLLSKNESEFPFIMLNVKDVEIYEIVGAVIIL